MLVKKLQAVALILGPLVFAASPLFWVDGHYGVNGGMLIALAMVPWVYGLLGEYERLRERIPDISGLWLLMLLVGMFGSISFGLQGFFEGVFEVGDRVALEGFVDYPTQSVFVLWIPGPVFPLSLLTFGVLIGWTRLSPRWVAVFICLAAVAFPLSRVLRNEWIAYVADLLVIVPFAQLAWNAWRRASTVSAKP